MVTVKDAEAFKKQMAEPDLVFITNENRARVEAMSKCDHDFKPVVPGGENGFHAHSLCSKCDAMRDEEWQWSD